MKRYTEQRTGCEHFFLEIRFRHPVLLTEENTEHV